MGGLFLILGLAQHFAAQYHNGISPDDGVLGMAGRHFPSLLLGQMGGYLFRMPSRLNFFFSPGRADPEGNPHLL